MWRIKIQDITDGVPLLSSYSDEISCSRTILNLEAEAVTFPVLVTARRDVSEGVCVFDFQAQDGSELPRWEPGAHIDVILPSGRIRQYSLTGDLLDRTTFRVAVLREEAGRGGSMELCDAVTVGQALAIDGPRNHFALEEAKRYLFIAGGIGVTPIASMIRSLGTKPDVQWQLLYGGRSRTSMAFADELLTLGGQVSIQPFDEHGHLDLGALDSPDPDLLVYCCGPGPLLDAVQQRMTEAGWKDQLRLERFAPGEAMDHDPDTGFDIVLERAGVRLHVPADRTVLAVIQEELPEHPFSCADGTCGTCETRVIAGVPDHRDWVMTDEEQAANDRMMVCVSRSKTPTLTLDL